MKDNGGSAFPVAAQLGETPGETICNEGMTLRDYFAAKAMQGILAGPCSREGVISKEWLDVPKFAYDIADEMLKAREA